MKQFVDLLIHNKSNGRKTITEGFQYSIMWVLANVSMGRVMVIMIFLTNYIYRKCAYAMLHDVQLKSKMIS